MHLFETPLSVDRAMNSIRNENGGGEAVFIGRVRASNRGKTVRYLQYECEAGMAEKEFERIIGEIRAKWPVKSVHIEHRIGKLEVGDIAVIVAISSEHRREALEACRYGIDELKHRVPIWKKEVSTTGEEWIGICEEET
ncbi:MAG TPA: molybdenum cofactor biosynthesis protein MoaE, partial [Acidobacteriota bacterium]|nr:molybdenum cofactor biosynthesis protein MoaE [Acidobacteriota bacterium]